MQSPVKFAQGTVAGVTATAQAVIGALQVFELISWTGDEVGAFMLVVTTLGTAAVGLIQAIWAPPNGNGT